MSEKKSLVGGLIPLPPLLFLFVFFPYCLFVCVCVYVCMRLFVVFIYTCKVKCLVSENGAVPAQRIFSVDRS